MKNENKINIRSIQSNINNKGEMGEKVNIDKLDKLDKHDKQIHFTENKGVLSTLGNNTSKKKINIANLFNLKDIKDKDENNYMETKIRELSKKIIQTERNNVKLSAIENTAKTRLIKGSHNKMNKRNTSSKDINMNEASKYSKQSQSLSKYYSMNESTSKSKNKRKSKPILVNSNNINKGKTDIIITNEKNDNLEKQRSVHEVHNIYNFYHSNLQNVENYILKKDNLKPSTININSVNKAKNIDWKTFNENQKMLITNSKNSAEKVYVNDHSDMKYSKEYFDFILKENEALKKKLMDKTKENKELQNTIKSINIVNVNNKNTSNLLDESKEIKNINEDIIQSNNHLDKINFDKKINKGKILNHSKSPINSKLNISECKLFLI